MRKKPASRLLIALLHFFIFDSKGKIRSRIFDIIYREYRGEFFIGVIFGEFSPQR